MVCLALLVTIASACKKNNDNVNQPALVGPNLNVFALATGNKLLSFNANNAATITKTSDITGLATGENIIGIDFRPATGELYGVSSASKIYVINTQTGAVRAISTAAFTPALSGTDVGFDFNPTVDRIRLVTNTGQNLRLHPETGVVAATDGNINGAANATVTAAAYTENKAGATTTTLFVIDPTNDKLYKQDPPNNGTLVEVGSLGMDVERAGGFDISSDGKAALAVLTVAGRTSLYYINITNGKAERIENDMAGTIIGLAIPTAPVAYAISATNDLVIFNPATGEQIVRPSSGITTGEAILGIDFRPANSQLYALGSTSRLYTVTVNATTAVFTPVGTTPFATLLSGTDFGFDFNPTVDRIRVVSNTGQNLRLNPNDGAVAAVDLVLNPGTPRITAAAYTNNFNGATTTTLYDIDTQTNMLYRQEPPNNGVLVSVGALGVTAASTNGFDIGGTSGIAYALLNVSGTTKVYTINLTTGAATAGATVTGNLRGFALGLGF
jgi:hypothetical protein